jgi:hypothetical protein
MRLSIFLPLAVLLFVAGNMGDASATSGSVALHAEPPVLERTLFSKPSHTLTITGSCPQGSDIVLKIVSPNRNYRLNKAGKGLGFVWLPVGHAEIRDIPGMYAILSSAKISNILSPTGQEEAGLTPGFEEVYKRCEVRFEKDPPPGAVAGLRREYISGLIRIFKEGGLYQNLEGAVSIEGHQFTASLVHPAGAPLGEYAIFCYAVRDGKASLLCQNKFLVTSSGLADWLATKARTDPAVYGVFAALMAVAVGLLVGVVFGRGAGH